MAFRVLACRIMPYQINNGMSGFVMLSCDVSSRGASSFAGTSSEVSSCRVSKCDVSSCIL